MIIHDPSIINNFQDYGIMLPIEASRADAIVSFLKQTGDCRLPILNIKESLDFLEESADCNADGLTILTRSDLERVHSSAFISDLFDSNLALEKHLLESYELLDKEGKPFRYEPQKAKKPLRDMFKNILKQIEGSCVACRIALKNKSGFSFFLSGGNHHSRYNNGAGFCLLNDVIIAARKMQAENRARLIWIIDVDVHKGCGSAELVDFIRKGINPTPFETGCNIITLSVHMAKGWPLDEETLRTAEAGKAPLIPSDIEIPIEQNEDDNYVPYLKKGLNEFLKLSNSRKADLAIVVDGADPYEHDGLKSSSLLRLTLDNCLERDMLIYDFLQSQKIPSAWILAGGYGERAWEVPANFLKTAGLNT
ncbi:MAG: hypothetical protein LBV52_01880 [Spirochaetaceae bacterium]|jgi:acetoin utilization deacetylase AcuC-like enzyme|nr:hypothetical protein [Spirochaetaceae bacterium]